MKRYVSLYLVIICLLLCSCSPQKRLARDFTKISKDAAIALYVPDSLIKINIRHDSLIENMDSCKIINVLNDNAFLDIMISSFESAINDYNLRLEYWEDGDRKPDSTHWIVDIPKIEVTEFFDYHNAFYLRQDSGYYYKVMPINEVNVASWFALSNGLTDELAFTEQNFIDQIKRTYDYDYNEVINYTVDTVNITGFYKFAAFLGKLYAGYCYDYFMNDYIKKNDKSEKKPDNQQYLFYRYDPYESYYFYTPKDKLIPVD